MKTRTVKGLMVPLSEYKTISSEATLYEAALILKQTRKEFDRKQDRHRALVVREDDQVVGMVSQLDLLKGLEPRYEEMGLSGRVSLAGFSPRFMKSMLESYRLWDKPLGDICKKAANRKVRDFMYVPTKGEYVEEDASLDEAVHQLIMGHHDCLLVTRKDVVVGVLRLNDVFGEVEASIEACKVA